MTAPQSVTVTAADFKRLVTPLMPIAKLTGRDLPVLNAVHFHVAGGYLVATATDRFRLAIHRMPTTAKRFTALVAHADVVEILRLFRPVRRERLPLTIKMTVAKGELTVCTVKPNESKPAPGGVYEPRFSAASVTFPVINGVFPKVGQLLTKHDWSVPARSWVGLNPHFLADWRLAVERNAPLLVVPGTDSAKPTLFMAGADFIGLQMPLRSSEAATIDLGSWTKALEPITAGPVIDQSAAS